MRKKIINIISMLLIVTILFSMIGCSNKANQDGLENNLAENSKTLTESLSELNITSLASNVNKNLSDIDVDYSKADKTSIYNEKTSTKINLDDLSVDGDGAKITASTITITDEGTYILTGTLQDGQLLIDVDKEKNVQLVLDNVTLNNSTGSAINVIQAEKVIITLAENSDNVLSDGSQYSDVEDSSPDAVIYSSDDLTINGMGNLNVSANYKHGIKSTDDLIIMDGNINIDAVEEALKGKDSVVIADGTINITAKGDGIKTSNDDEKGYIVIDGGNITIDSKVNGIESQKAIIINDGYFNITCGQDAIHTNGAIQINSGDITINTTDDALHADEALYIENGSITIENCYEGLEAVDVFINGGFIDINAKDDGINAAGGSDDDANPKDHFNEVAGDQIIEINGGYVHIIADGDGLDSNGTIVMNAGTVVVDGAVTEMGDPAIDVNAQASFTYKGGTLAAVGCDSMFIVPTIDNQPVVTVMMGDLIEKGELITLSDEDGNSIITINPQHDYETMMFSSSNLKIGNTYSITVGGSYDGETIDGTLYTNSVLVGGNKLFNFDMDETLIVLDKDGNEADLSNYGNGGGRGGKPNGMDGERQMNPEDILKMLPIVDGVLTLADGTTYEVPQGEVPTLNGETIIFSNGVEVSMFQIMGDMKGMGGMGDRGQGPPQR